MSQDSPSRKLDQYIVRFPDGMRDRLKDAAAVNNRSLNAEIIARLERSFDPMAHIEPEQKDWLLGIIRSEIDKAVGLVEKDGETG